MRTSYSRGLPVFLPRNDVAQCTVLCDFKKYITRAEELTHYFHSWASAFMSQDVQGFMGPLLFLFTSIHSVVRV